MTPLRPCGTCYQCCVTLGINALKKRAGQACKHLNGSISPEGRCSIYINRPEACSKYYCCWLAGMGTDDMRPDKSGVLVSAYPPEGPYTKFNATIHITNEEKAGDFEDPNSNLQRITQILIETGCNEIKIVFGTKPPSPILHLSKGLIWKGKTMKAKSYEDLDFITTNPPIGKYSLTPAKEST